MNKFNAMTIEDLKHKRDAVWSQVVRSETVWSEDAAELVRAFDELLRRLQSDHPIDNEPTIRITQAQLDEALADDGPRDAFNTEELYG